MLVSAVSAVDCVEEPELVLDTLVRELAVWIEWAGLLGMELSVCCQLGLLREWCVKGWEWEDLRYWFCGWNSTFAWHFGKPWTPEFENVIAEVEDLFRWGKLLWVWEGWTDVWRRRVQGIDLKMLAWTNCEILWMNLWLRMDKKDVKVCARWIEAGNIENGF